MTRTPDLTLDAVWRRRWLVFASGVFSNVALLVPQVLFGSLDASARWHWPILGGGIMVGLVGAVSIHHAFTRLGRMFPPEHIGREASRRRAWLYAWSCAFLGAAIGSFSALLDLVWPVPAFAGYLALLFAAGGVQASRVRRRYPSS